MAYNVRVFGHRGLEQMPIVKPRQFTSETVFQLAQPYEFAQTLSVSAVAVSSAPVADSNSGASVNILRIEVPDGQTVRYEINPPSRNVVAGVNSPSLSGKDQFYFKSGFTVSLIDASALP